LAKRETESEPSETPPPIQPVLTSAQIGRKKARLAGKALAGNIAAENVQLQWLQYTGSNWLGRVGKKSPESVKLNPKWVVWSFTNGFYNQCVTGVGKWIKIPPGDSSGITDPPPAHLENKPVQYQAKGNTCLATSFASVLHMAGHEQAGMLLQLKISTLEQGTNVVQNFVNLVNASKIRNSSGKMLMMRSVVNYDVLTGETPAAVVLQGTDGGIAHAISIFDEFVVESSWGFALPRTKETFDWCCSPAKFKKPHRVYILK
jgi:hypothetical protein